MGFVHELDKDNTTRCWFACDECGFKIPIEVWSLSIPQVVDYKIKNGWFNIDGTRENNYISKSYCNSCDKALGYIKDTPAGEGEKNECKADGIT